jgi:uncharacterized alkaline shock family protein YloU
MRNTDQRQPGGSLRISRNVIATVAGIAAQEIEGVHGLAPYTANLTGWVIKKQTARPIAITLNDDVAIIDIHVVLKSGYTIPEVAEQIQVAVKDAVQSMTGIAVSKVNINIAGIDFGTQQGEAVLED